MVNAYPVPMLEDLFDDPTATAARTSGLTPALRRSRLAVLKKAPAAYRWCRPRGRCATRAAPLTIQRGSAVSAATLRRSGGT